MLFVAAAEMLAEQINFVCAFYCPHKNVWVSKLIYVLTSFFISSIKGFSMASIPYTEIKVDFTRDIRCILDSFDLYFGDKLPRVK